MAVWQPHKLSTKLCLLFDSGRCTVDEFARRAEVKPLMIERLAKQEFKIAPETRLRIGRVLYEYQRAFPEARPGINPPVRLVTDDSGHTPLPDTTPRGVFEELDVFEGRRVFKAIDSEGVCRARIEVCAHDIRSRAQERRLKDRLSGYLDAVNPPVEGMSSNDT